MSIIKVFFKCVASLRVSGGAGSVFPALSLCVLCNLCGYQNDTHSKMNTMVRSKIAVCEDISGSIEKPSKL